MVALKMDFSALVVALLAVAGVRAQDFSDPFENRITVDDVVLENQPCNGGCGEFLGTFSPPVAIGPNRVWDFCLSQETCVSGGADEQCTFSCRTLSRPALGDFCDTENPECPDLSTDTLECTPVCEPLDRPRSGGELGQFCQFDCPGNRVLGLSPCLSTADCDALPDVFTTNSGFANGCVANRDLGCQDSDGNEVVDASLANGRCEYSCVPKEGICGGADSERCRCTSSRGCEIPE